MTALIILAFLLAGCSLASDITPPPGYQAPTARPAVLTGPTYPLIAPNPSKGVVIYAEKCAPCHGTTGQGDGPQSGQLPNPVPAIGSADLARQSVPSEWYAVITEGRLDRFMPGFTASLSDSQRWDVLSYVYSLSQPADILAAGKEVFTTECASCHGGQASSGGQGTSAPVDFTKPSQAAASSQAEIKSVVENGISPDMPAYTGKLSEDALWSLAAYVQSLGMSQPDAQVAEELQAQATASTPQATQVVTAGSTTGPSTGSTTVPAVGETAVPAQPGETATPGILYGSVSGQVINGSGGAIPASMGVTLLGFDDMNEVLTLQTTADASGKYVFTDVEMPANRVFMTTAEYNQSVFNSDVAHTVNGGEPLSLDLVVYDSTSDLTGLKIDRVHLLFDFTDPANVQVVEMYIISNPTNQVIASEKPGDPLINYALPAEATNLMFQDGEIGGRYIKTADGFGDTQAIMPGVSQHQVLFGYNLPYEDALDFSVPVPLPADAAILMVPEGGIKVTSDQLVDSGTRSAEDTTLHIYTASNLASGTILKFELKGRPGDQAASILDMTDRQGLIIGLAALGLLLIGAGGWLYFRRGRPRLITESTDEVPSAAQAEQEDADSLIDAIIALDDQFRSGGISEQAYRQRRDELKQRLAGVVGGESKAI